MAVGASADASADSSIAIGSRATAEGVESIAIGPSISSTVTTVATGDNAIAMGTGTPAGEPRHTIAMLTTL